MAKNQKKITLASFNYLIEVSAIPEKTRAEYLNKLLKRNNSLTQINVRLLKIVYEYINENQLSQWNPDAICRELGISMDSLYNHKSRLLKGLREYYFDWKRLEKEIDSKYNQDAINLKLEKVRKMNEIGMRREAKNEYLKLESIIIESTQTPEVKIVLTTEVYWEICSYYGDKEDKRRFNYYFTRFYSYSESIKSIKLSQEQKALVDLRISYSNFLLNFLEYIKHSQRRMKQYYIDRIYNCAKILKDLNYLLSALYCKATIKMHLKEFDDAIKICEEGNKYANRIGNETKKHTFNLLIYLAELKLNLHPNSQPFSHALQYYNKINKSERFKEDTILLVNIIGDLFIYERRPEIIEILRNHSNTNILIGNYRRAVYLRYWIESEIFNNRIISLFNTENISKKGYLELNKPDIILHDDIEKLCVNTLCYHEELKYTFFISKIYLFQLRSYFLKSLDYSKAIFIINKLDYLKRKKKILTPLSFECIRLAFIMMEHKANKKVMLSRYEYRLQKIINEFMEKPSECNIMDYAVLSHLTGLLKCKEITSMVKTFYQWLQTNHPEILEPAFRGIKERESKIYTVSGAA